MIIQGTKKFLDAIPFQPNAAAEQETDSFHCWHANLLLIDRRKTIVLMNDSNRYTIILHGVKAKELKKLDELIPEAIRQVLKAERIRDEIIEQYIEAAGAVTFQKTKNRSMISKLNQACDHTWACSRYFDPDMIVQVRASVKASCYLVGGTNTPMIEPRVEMFNELESRSKEQIFTGKTVQMKISMALAGQSVWRRVLIPIDFKFGDFHHILQILFDWQYAHLHEFYLFKRETEDDSGKPSLNIVMNEEALEYGRGVEMQLERDVSLSDVLPKHDYMKYIYDFGDGWEHDIVVEAVHDDKPLRSPICLEGEGNAPPEDCGGAPGFAEFLEVVGDPEHPEYESMRIWAQSQGYKSFDLEMVNRRLSGI